MGNVTIKRRGIRVCDTLFSTSCTLTEEISETKELTADFTLPNRVRFERGDYVEVKGDKYIFTEEPTETMTSKGEFKYSAVLKDESAYLDDIQFMFLDESTSGTIYASRCDFELTATIEEFLSIIIRNLERGRHHGWEYSVDDNSIDRSEIKDLSFSNQTCKDALIAVCDAFELEWSFSNKTIHVSKEFKQMTDIRLSYPDNLLSPIKVEHSDDDNTCSRLYVFGGERNIPNDYNNGTSSRLLMDGKQEYLERDSDYLKERVKIFEDIYPRRKGIVQGVTINQVGIQFVRDNTLDFDINKQLTDVSAKIAFTSGRLVGYEFEIASYKNTAHLIEIKQQTKDGVVIPNETLRAQQGDTYVLLDIRMPEEYITNAEKELREEAQKFFDEKCNDKMTVNVDVSTIWVIQNGIKFTPSQMIRLYAPELDIDRRIRITKVVSYPFEVVSLRMKQNITLSDFIKKSKIKTMEKNIKSNSQNQSFSLKVQTNVNKTTSQYSTQMQNTLSWVIP